MDSRQAATKSDAELVGEARKGLQDSFAELVRRHHAAMAGLCRSLLSDPSQAEDAAQEVFLKAYRALNGFQGQSSFSTWLYRIASNHCLDLLRRRTRERTDSLEALLESGGDRALSQMSDAASAAPPFESADFIKRLLEELPPDYRVILTLREIEGLSYLEMSQALNCSLDAVKARLKRARKAVEELARHIQESENV